VSKEQVYKALQHASEQVGRANYILAYSKATPAQQRAVLRGKPLKTFTVTQAHDSLVKAMAAVMQGKMSEEEGMALVTSPEVMRERFPK
jgi:hypothetical protein